MANLTFEAPDLVRFPALALAREALEAGGGAPTVLNAANEVAVGEFLIAGSDFGGIPALVEATLEAADARGLLGEPADVEAALAVDHIAQIAGQGALPEIAVKAS